MPTYRVTWHRHGAKPVRRDIQANGPREAWTKAVNRCQVFEWVHSVEILAQTAESVVRASK